MGILELIDLRKRFGDKEVLKGLTLSVPEGSIFGFIGRNGAGKTTAMRIALGLLQADGGEARVAGEAVAFGSAATNRCVGYLPDVPEFYSFMTAPKYLRFCGELSGVDGKALALRSEELLQTVGLAGERHRIGGFSRGMKQRLGVAQALLNRPRLLICDEPTSALDPLGRRELLELLSSVREQTTVLFSTHILADVERICTSVALLHNGVITLEGGLSELRRRYRVEEYCIEAEDLGQLAELSERFGGRIEEGRMVLRDRGEELFALLRYAGEHRVSLSRVERMEPSLETLFMEVVEK